MATPPLLGRIFRVSITDTDPPTLYLVNGEKDWIAIDWTDIMGTGEVSLGGTPGWTVTSGLTKTGESASGLVAILKVEATAEGPQVATCPLTITDSGRKFIRSINLIVLPRM